VAVAPAPLITGPVVRPSSAMHRSAHASSASTSSSTGAHHNKLRSSSVSIGKELRPQDTLSTATASLSPHGSLESGKLQFGNVYMAYACFKHIL
jgi:hypothetical protein